MARKKKTTECPHCGGELVAGLAHRYLLRCTNWGECARYVVAD